MNLKNAEINLYKRYPKCVLHMKHRLESKRFGLVFGAGISKPLNIPNWDELVTSISLDEEVKGDKILVAKPKDNSLAIAKVQLLFEHFRMKNYPVSQKHGFDRSKEKEIKLQWWEVLRRHIYNRGKKIKDEKIDTKKNEEKSKRYLRSHPYIRFYTQVIKKTPVTINYNFDDLLERIILVSRSSKEKNETRGYESAWDFRMQFQNDKGVIFHPNGLVPENPMEIGSSFFVFSEDDFGEQMMDVMTGKHVSLIHHFVKNTCLLIGLSLEDQTLRHILRSSAKLCPGHYHYYVRYTRGESLNKQKREAIRQANFNVYNLITLFLDDEGIAALGSLISASDKYVKNVARRAKSFNNYFYYITGAPGAGKSTLVSHLRSFFYHEEWLEQRIGELGKSFKDLNDEERNKVDNWVARQFRLKNENFLKSKCAIHIVDRSPLDPISFTKEGEWSDKAIFLMKNVLKKRKRIQEGQILMLTDSEKNLSFRTKSRYRKSQENDLGLLQKNLIKIFGKTAEEIRVDGRNINEVVKMVSRKIHFGDYVPHKLEDRLKEIKMGKI